jgi:hypothetical protein
VAAVKHLRADEIVELTLTPYVTARPCRLKTALEAVIQLSRDGALGYWWISRGGETLWSVILARRILETMADQRH